MTNQERAETIAKAVYICDCGAWCEHVKTFENLITSQLDEAVKEAVKSANSNQWYSYDHGFKEGFASAVEKAAGIAREWVTNPEVDLRIQDEIRSLSPEEKR